MIGGKAKARGEAMADADGTFLTVDSACALSVACYWASAKTQLSLTRALEFAPGSLCAVANIASHLAALLLVCLLARKAAPLSERRGLTAVSACAFVTSALLLEASLNFSGPLLALASNMLAGAASALALVLWGEGMASARPQRYLPIMLLGAVASLLVQLACQGLPTPMLAATPSVLALCSLALSRRARLFGNSAPERPGDRLADPVLSDVPWRVLFACLVFSVPSAFAEAGPVGEDGAVMPLAQLAALLLLICAGRAASSLGEDVLPTAATFSLAGSMAFLPLVYPGGSGLLVGVLSGAGALVFRACLYTDLCLMALRREAPFALTFAAGTACLDAGCIVGNLARAFLPSGSMHVVGFALLTTYLVFLAGFLFVRLPRRNPSGQVGQGGHDQERSSREGQDAPRLMATGLERLAQEHDLTQREADILQLILQGKKTPNIADTLGLSVNTVKTHRRHLYQKLGCSSSEELFSLALGEDAEATPVDKDDG